MKEGDVFYRFYNAPITWSVGASDPILDKYICIKTTEKGGWIKKEGRDAGKKRFLRDKGRVHFAYPTIDEAWGSYIIRLNKRIEHLERQLNDTKLHLEKAKNYKYNKSRAD